MRHWTDSKIQVHAFYCVLALLLTSLLQWEARKSEPLSVNRLREELAGIQETLVVFPRRRGQQQFPTATRLTHMSGLQQRLFTALGLDRHASAAR